MDYWSAKKSQVVDFVKENKFNKQLLRELLESFFLDMEEVMEDMKKRR